MRMKLKLNRSSVPLRAAVVEKPLPVVMDSTVALAGILSFRALSWGLDDRESSTQVMAVPHRRADGARWKRREDSRRSRLRGGKAARSGGHVLLFHPLISPALPPGAGGPRVRIHHHLIAAVVETLGRIIREGAAADRAVESALRQHPKWGSRDRRLVAEHVYDLVRWRRWYAHLAEVDDAAPGDGALWRMWEAYWIARGGEPVDFDECAGITAERIEARKAVEVSPAVRASFPDWLYELGAAELGSAWPDMATALNETASVFLRANSLRTTVPALIAALQKEGTPARTVADLPGALELEKRVSFAASHAFRTGLFEVQDAGSQLIAPMLGAEPGMLVIDGCAGAGGKSLHLAALMKNEGRIIAQDVRAAVLERLKDRATRAGASIIRAEALSSPDVVTKRAGTADRLLLDAPCSGLGVLRRNADAKWKLTPEELDRVTALQRDILRTAPVMLKPGGCMVYATCSILPRENGDQIRAFMAENPGAWALEDERHLLPGAPGDGFYAARLRKL